MTDVVDRLIGHPAGHRTVADDGNDVSVRVGACVASDRHAIGVREDRGGVTVLDVVVLGFFPARIPGEAAGLTQLLELLLAPRDDLVGIGLVAGVPQDGIGR